MLSTKHVFLIGFMGSGKTTIGSLLSKATNRPFVDLDNKIEIEQGKTVSELFAAMGENQFRELERKALLNSAKGSSCIISTGGGAPCFFNNMEVMKEMGITIYLKASANDLATRLKDSATTRPLLKGKGPSDLPTYIESMLSHREPFYLMAEYVVGTDGLTDMAVLQRCLDIVSGTK